MAETHTPPPDSLLRCKCVEYRWKDGRLYRCSVREWERMQKEKK